MAKISLALAAALTLAAGAAFGGAAKADSTRYYYYDDSPTLTYSHTPRVYYYNDPVIVTPAPRIYYYTEPRYMYAEPRYMVRSNTTYYYAPSNHDHYSLSSPAYVSTPAPYGYVPPGLSITVPTGTYAPFYGGWNSYSTDGGYSGYRIGR